MKGSVAVALACAVALEAPAGTSPGSSMTTRRWPPRKNSLTRIARSTRVAPRRLRGTDGTHRRTGRGRLPGNASLHRDHPRRDCSFGAVLAGPQRHPRCLGCPGSAGRLPAAPGGRRRAHLSGGAHRCGHHRRHRRLCDSGLVQRDGQLPLRPRPRREARWSIVERCSTVTRSMSPTSPWALDPAWGVRSRRNSWLPSVAFPVPNMGGRTLLGSRLWESRR